MRAERLDEGGLAFRLAPRINAAGRLYRADAGVELLLTEDEERAEEIAEELGRANSERRATEREVDAAAEAARRELPEELREATGSSSRGRGGIPAWSGSSPRAWSSATTGRWSSSPSTERAAGAARAAASPASICSRARGVLASTSTTSAATRPPPGLR